MKNVVKFALIFCLELTSNPQLEKLQWHKVSSHLQWWGGGILNHLRLIVFILVYWITLFFADSVSEFAFINEEYILSNSFKGSILLLYASPGGSTIPKEHSFDLKKSYSGILGPKLCRSFRHTQLYSNFFPAMNVD